MSNPFLLVVNQISPVFRIFCRRTRALGVLPSAAL